MIKVGIVAPQCHLGGAELWMLGLLQWCDPAQVEFAGVAILAETAANLWMVERIARHCPVGFGAEAIGRLSLTCDVVLVWGVPAGAQVLPDRPRRCQVVLVSHGIGPYTAAVFGQSENADAFAAVSRSALAPIPEQLRARTSVIPNAVDPDRVRVSVTREAMLDRWGVGPGAKVLGYLGRLSEEKDPGAVARAVASLPDDWVGVVVGDGRLLPEVVRDGHCAAPGRIYFPGVVQDVGSALGAFDCLLLPSREEACSLTLLEGWGAGVPVVATPVGTAGERPELVRTIPVGASGPEIAAAILADRRDLEGTAARVELARRVVAEEHSPDRFGRAWTDFLVRVAAGRALPAVPREIQGTRVAVVVPCHDYGRFLGAALESVLRQTVPAAEVVVVDDSSTDDTREVAGRFQDLGVRYLRVEHRHPYPTRAAGFRATTAEVVCFLDADDVLAPDYLERGLPLFQDRQVGWVYSDIQMFGARDERVRYPEFDRGRLERENYCHVASLVRRRAIEMTDAFGGPRPSASHADWYLWSCLAEHGWRGARQESLYRYRRHEAAMLETSQDPYRVRANLDLAEVTIFTALSGRRFAWGPYRAWLDHQRWPRHLCRLVLLDSSGDEGFARGVRQYLAGSRYRDVRYLSFEAGDPGLADRPRPEAATAVRLACSRIYGRMARALETPFCLVVEDDTIPPAGVISALMRRMDRDVAYVAACYPSRHGTDWIAFDSEHRHLPRGQGVQEIGGCGFGCTLIRRAALEGEHFASLDGESPDYDVAFADRLRGAGWTLLMDWGQECRHLQAPDQD